MNVRKTVVMLAVGVLSGAARGQTYYETEPNPSKALANAFTLADGESISGIVVGGDNDTFLIRTTPLPLAIYRHTLVISSPTAGHTASIRGLSQTDGVINLNSDVGVQMSSTTTTPPRMLCWYGFGKEEQLYIRVMGSSGTTAPYIATHSIEEVTEVPTIPAPLGASWEPGTIRIEGISGMDTDLWVYDGDMSPLPEYGNDNGPNGAQVGLLRVYDPSVHTIAVSTFNLANNQASPPDDARRSGSVLDFPDVVVESSAGSLGDVSLAVIAASEELTVAPLIKTRYFEVKWARFVVGGESGACCFYDESCKLEVASSCQNKGGVYLGPSTMCNPPPCAYIPTGACCFFEGSCSVTAPSECSQFGGTYRGDDSTCTPNYCAGACCLPDQGGCADTGPDLCSELSGTYYGDATVCEADTCLRGACCLPDGTCELRESDPCWADFGEFYGEGAQCADIVCHTGACCLPDGSCDQFSWSGCAQQGGVYHGDEVPCAAVTCPQPGACCLPDGACIEELQDRCVGQSGSFAGEGTSCATAGCPPAGACCLVDSTCVVRTLESCESWNGTWSGASTACTPNSCPPMTGACCLPDLTCVQTTQEDCLITQGGRSWGPHQACAEGVCPGCAATETIKVVSPPGNQTYFGDSVAIDGDLAVVGKPWANRAYVYVGSFGGSWTLQSELQAATGSPLSFGTAVAIQGERILVGGNGAAYVFVREWDGSWTQEAELTPSDSPPSSQFGAAVALENDTAVIGAPHRAGAAGTDAGAAYVFARSGASWTQQALLEPNDAAARDNFGFTVGISGNLIVVGAPYASRGPAFCGAAYLFAGSGGAWSQQVALSAPMPRHDDLFGWAVAVEGGVIAVSAPNASEYPWQPRCGYVCIFDAGGTQTAVVTASDGVIDDWFGGSVAIHDEQLLVGAMGDDRPDAPWTQMGAAYLYQRRTSSEWRQQAKLLGDYYSHLVGWTCALSDGEAIVGGPGMETGEVYFYRLECPGACCYEEGACDTTLAAGCTGVWHGEWASCDAAQCPQPAGACCYPDGACEYLAEAACTGQWLGYGTDCEINACPQPSGACCHADGHCEDLEASQCHGDWLGINTECATASCPQPVGACCLTAGCSELTRAECDQAGGAGWSAGQSCAPDPCPLCESQLELALPLDPVSGDQLGGSVAIRGDVLVVGATMPYSGAGRVLVFSRIGPDWAQTAELTATSSFSVRWFGAAVAVDGDTILVGAPGTMVHGLNIPGAAYVFVRTGETWTQEAELIAANAEPVDQFGASVALSGNVALVGSIHSSGGQEYAGAAYVFTRSGTTWTQQAQLGPAGGPQAWELFGSSVAIEGQTALVGARLSEPVHAGAAYVFTRAGETWSQEARLAIGEWQNYFGNSVALRGETALVGAPGRDFGRGAAYVFTRTGSTWSSPTLLTAADGEQYDSFGHSVALDGTTLLIGAVSDELPDSPRNCGSAYIFTPHADSWLQRGKLAPATPQDENGGASVAISEGVAVFGAPMSSRGSASRGGAAYVYELGCFGACCATDGACAVVRESECLGVWHGEQSTCATGLCPPQGACCFMDERCEQRGEIECAAAGGRRWTEGEACAPGLCLRPAGDCDGDFDVDGDDFRELALCFAGPTWPLVPSCACFDLNEDGFVDLRDFAELQTAFTGTPP